MYNIDEAVPITVSSSSDAVLGQFDCACSYAKQLARDMFGVTPEGHFDRVNDAERSTCSINIEFVGLVMSGGMMGWDHVYRFNAWVTKDDDA